MFIDASSCTLSAVFAQESEATAYASQKFNSAERMHSITANVLLFYTTRKIQVIFYREIFKGSHWLQSPWISDILKNKHIEKYLSPRMIWCTLRIEEFNIYYRTKARNNKCCCRLSIKNTITRYQRQRNVKHNLCISDFLGNKLKKKSNWGTGERSRI